MNYLSILLAALFISVLPLNALASKPDIVGPKVDIVDNNIVVSLSIANAYELKSTINDGIEKKIIYTIELLRVWRFWPDEFVVSKSIEKIISFDNLRGQYRATSYDGVVKTDKRFADLRSMTDWAFTAENINVANTKHLEPGQYYIRIVVESKIMEQAPLLGLLMFFLPEAEMSLAKEASYFTVGEDK